MFLLWLYADSVEEVAGCDGGGNRLACAVASDELAVGPDGWTWRKNLGRGLDAVVHAGFCLEGEGNVSGGLSDVGELRRGAG